MPRLLKDTFKAWIDKMPGSRPKLIVKGDVEVPTSGWTVNLVRKVPQGFNPKILMLDVVAEKPHGVVMEIITKIPLRFEESPPQVDYTQVTASDAQDQVTVDVETTH